MEKRNSNLKPVFLLGAVRTLLCAVLVTAAATGIWGQEPSGDLTEKSLEDLMNIEVTSASKKEQKVFETAAAVYVITQEDIRHSGATSIPELLRTVPGLDVAHMDANKWAISPRGFNERFADKMLILIDGRAVYDPLFSGVYWDAQDTVLEDIDRIEVIRGPGATLWGANAVNGVINIITKQAKDTQGGLVTVGGGSLERGSGAVRYGGQLHGPGYYRIFAKYFNRSPFEDSFGHKAADSWDVLRGGLRTDWDLSSRDALTVQGDIYEGSAGQTAEGLLSLSPPMTGSFNDRTRMNGGNVLGRWHHTSSSRFDTTFRAYYDSTERDQLGVLGEFGHAVDLDFQQHFATGHGHDLVWGAGYRYSADRTEGSLMISFDPISRSTSLYSTFLQDEITLVPGRLRVTLGTKLEHNFYSGFALQPNVRMFWSPYTHYAIWAAISRAVESSSRLDANVRVNDDAFVDQNGVINLVSKFGRPHLPAEPTVAYELGQRAQVGKWFSFDLATFYNHYGNRHTKEPGVPYFEDSPPPRHLVLPFYTFSKIQGETHGIEVASRFKVVNHWSLSASYTFFQIHLHADPTSLDFTTAKETEGSSPRQEFQVHSQLDLHHNLEFDTALYYVGRVPGPQIPAYTRVDARLGWRPAEAVQLSVGLQNLLDPRHPEFGSGDFVSTTQVKRSVYAKLTWRF
jgi:iron complex outermembrane receptor protein